MMMIPQGKYVTNSFVLSNFKYLTHYEIDTDRSKVKIEDNLSANSQNLSNLLLVYNFKYSYLQIYFCNGTKFYSI